jgi:hypothetical protein
MKELGRHLFLVLLGQGEDLVAEGEFVIRPQFEGGPDNGPQGLEAGQYAGCRMRTSQKASPRSRY